MSAFTTGSLTTHARAAHAAAAIAVAAAHVAYVEASIRGEDVTDAAATVAAAAAVHARVGVAAARVARRADEARAAARWSHVEAVLEKVRAALADGPASETGLALTTRTRGDLVREALRALLVRGEVARMSGGFCLMPVRSSSAAA